MAVVETNLLMQNQNLEKVSALLEHKLKNATLGSNVQRVQVLLQSLIAGAELSFNDNVPRYNARRNYAATSMSSFIDDCYSGYQHVIPERATQR